MFVFDWFMDWIYGKVMEFVQDFFSYLSGMGVEIFSLSWIQAVIEFFRLFGWSMYVIALVVAIFDVAIAYQNGQGNMKDAGLGAIKGFMAVNLFTVVPIELYKLAVDIQNVAPAYVPAMLVSFLLVGLTAAAARPQKMRFYPFAATRRRTFRARTFASFRRAHLSYSSGGRPRARASASRALSPANTAS